MSDEINPVLRVTQLDTNELNESLLSTIKRSINEDFFKYIQLKFVQRYQVEIFSGLKFLLWYHTYGKNGQTIGQSIFDWSYAFDTNSKKRVILIKKIVHAIIFCLDEWFEQKFLNLVKKLITYVFVRKQDSNNTTESSTFSRNLNRFFNILSQIYKSLSFLNYAVFLFNGKYLNIWERLLKLRPVYNRPQFMSQSNASTETSIREELWQTYFSLFRLSSSLFDFQVFYQKFLKKRLTSTRSRADIVDPESGVSKCGLCEKPPVTAHRAVATQGKVTCKHVFCYFCIKQAISESDNDEYICNICSFPLKEVELFLKK